ncbi:hypothetical protein MUK42_18313, partial [Musa troglodytarum]
VSVAAIGSSPIQIPILHLSRRPLLNNRCIIFSVAEHGEEGRMAPRGGADKSGEASVAPDMGGNTGKVESMGALRCED